jgi:uncharacterized protein (TIGR03435 family)
VGCRILNTRLTVPLRRTLLLLALTAPLALAQTPPPVSAPPVPAFDVISVKPNKTANGTTRVRLSPDGLAAENVTVHALLLESYRLNEDQLFGEPAWVKTERFDIQAKVAGTDVAALARLPANQRRSMFSQVLTDQFRLTTHTETRQLPVYALTVAKGGIKFKQHVPDPAHPEHENGSGWFDVGPGRIVALGTTLDYFLFALSQNLDRTFVDKTGLTGSYDFELHWTPDDGPVTPDSGPSIFTAIQEQLGLKLESTKGPVPILVIDHIERPSEN